MTTLRRRRAKSLEGLQQGSARLTGLKQQVHQAWSIASSWQALIDQADEARIDAVRQLQSTNLELQVCYKQEESTAVGSSSVASVLPFLVHRGTYGRSAALPSCTLPAGHFEQGQDAG